MKQPVFRVVRLGGYLTITLLLALTACLIAQAQTVNRTQLFNEIRELVLQRANTTDAAALQRLNEQIREKESLFLAPAPEDFAQHAEFLRQPDTGLIRLMPRERFENVLGVRGGGAYYSFARLGHEYNSGSDLELQQNGFSVGFNGANFGFLASLGIANFSDFTLNHPGVKYLADFVAPLVEAEARAQYQRAGAGFVENGFNYRNRVNAVLNTNYVLRSIDYGNSDNLVVFRATRQDTDGSYIIQWKLLKWFATPQLNGTGVIASVSAASYQRGVYGRGSIVALFGENLTTQTQVAATTPLPTSLGNVRVVFFPGGLGVPLFAVTPGQVNFLIPNDAPYGWARISVRRADGKSADELIRIVPVEPGLFSANADGQGVAAALVFRSPAGGQPRYEPVARFDSSTNQFVAVPIPVTSFTEGVFLVLFGTGLRDSGLGKVAVTIAGEPMIVLYAGAQGSPGLDQVNVVLPPMLAGKGEVDVKLIAEGKIANVVRINIK
jgi:uncharacterized protein (TIGR03437 family)